MKYLLLLILITADKSCDSGKGPALLKATSQRWVGGAAGSGTGTYYQIYLDLEPDSSYIFDSLWVKHHRISVEVKSEAAKKDTMHLYANDFVRIDPNPSDNGSFRSITPADIAPPVPDAGEGVLGYFYHGKRSYLIIPKWTVLKALNYQ